MDDLRIADHPLNSVAPGSRWSLQLLYSVCPGAGKPFLACLLAGLLAAGCSAPDETAATWLDYFEPVDSLHVADSVLLRMLQERDSDEHGPGPWRLRDLASQPWLLSPADGRRAADAMMGLPLDVGTVPYWPSWTLILGAMSEGVVFGATNLVYVIRAYGADGSQADSIFAAPPSWQQARRPEPGEFGYATDAQLRAYFSTFTVITGLAAVGEGVLIVTHGHWEWHGNEATDPAGRLGRLVGGRSPGARWSARSSRANVYVFGGRRVTDAPSPGEILGYGPGRVVFGRRMADGVGYMLTEFVLRRAS